MNPYDIIRRPVVTEKSMYQQTKLNAYTFDVATGANKIEVKDAIERLFKVKVIKIAIRRRDGKQRRTKHGIGFTSERKLALVTLAEGQKIEGM